MYCHICLTLSILVNIFLFWTLMIWLKFAIQLHPKVAYHGRWFQLNAISWSVSSKYPLGKIPDESNRGKASLCGDSLLCLDSDYHKSDGLLDFDAAIWITDVKLIRTRLTVTWIAGYVLIVCHNVLFHMPNTFYFILSVLRSNHPYSRNGIPAS